MGYSHVVITMVPLLRLSASHLPGMICRPPTCQARPPAAGARGKSKAWSRLARCAALARRTGHRRGGRKWKRRRRGAWRVKVCHRRRERDGQKTRTGSIDNAFISSCHRVQWDTSHVRYEAVRGAMSGAGSGRTRDRRSPRRRRRRLAVHVACPPGARTRARRC